MGLRKLLERLFPGNTTEFDVVVDRFKSSNISEIRYDTKRLILAIRFKNGGHYLYYDVPDSVVRGFRRADSKGKYHATKVKGRYKYKRLKT